MVDDAEPGGTAKTTTEASSNGDADANDANRCATMVHMLLSDANLCAARWIRGATT